MRDRSSFSSIVMATVMLAGGLPVMAQDASPSPADSPPPVTSPEGGTPYVDADGVTHGTVTIRSVADPYTEFDPTYPPAEGERYVLLDVVFEAAADQPFWADPYAIVLQDAEGYLRWSSSLPRVQPVTLPDFQSQTMGPGDRLSGAIGFKVPTGAVSDAVLYLPESERMITLSTFTQAEPRPVGTEVEVADAAGVSHGTVTVRAIRDPYTEFDPAQPPAEGTRYVLATVVFQAAIDQQLGFDPWQIVLQDENGRFIRPSRVPRPAEDIVPDLQAQVLAPDDRSSGYVGYNVPADTRITSVLWAPEAGRFIRIADVDG